MDLLQQSGREGFSQFSQNVLKMMKVVQSLSGNLLSVMQSSLTLNPELYKRMCVISQAISILWLSMRSDPDGRKWKILQIFLSDCVLKCSSSSSIGVYVGGRCLCCQLICRTHIFSPPSVFFFAVLPPPPFFKPFFTPCIKVSCCRVFMLLSSHKNEDVVLCFCSSFTQNPLSLSLSISGFKMS